MNISVVIPLYNEEESINELVAWIAKVMYDNNYTYEIVIVDDGSTDNSWNEIVKLTEEYGSVRALRFRRNYGKSAALFCGFREAEGDVVFTLDADLQDSPDEIPAMYRMITVDNFDLVSGWKKKRHDPITKTIPSKFYNWVARKTTGINLHDMNCGLKAYRRDVVKSIEVYGEMHRYIPVLAKQAGFDKIGEKVVAHQARKYGVTKFGIERFINGFLDLMSILFMTKFGKKPMHLFGTIGVFIFFVGFVAAVVVGALKLVALSRGISAPLVTSSPYFYLSLTCMILGTQLFLTGFLGELVSRSSNDRNNYQIKETID
ncbi:MAG: glycosyltransferase family 2 protein [Salinivirgaceae bacterium]|nr:glycosyltransferase family 2 protein [Salinivirgaceae bacterium]MBO7432623.1 glycosyltransferase family 2 protein [Salinivirgaceae bacterium]MBO7594455.1 glycosyltransferase family 2 protein [Salinivirgaceae bacterium]MBR5168539.1 glycosyltransferase family 2 protein [Salinivirgaceae bacterium]